MKLMGLFKYFDREFDVSVPDKAKRVKSTVIRREWPREDLLWKGKVLVALSAKLAPEWMI